MVTQETCVLLVELPTGNINAVLLLDEGNLLWLIVFKKMFEFQKFQMFIYAFLESWNKLKYANLRSVFSTGAMGASAPAILKKSLIKVPIL